LGYLIPILGGWGEECRAVRAKSAKPRRLLVQSRTPKKSFVFLLEEKIRRAQIKKCEQNFSVVWRALASGGGAGQSFRSKWVRAKFRIEHNLFILYVKSVHFKLGEYMKIGLDFDGVISDC